MPPRPDGLCRHCGTSGWILGRGLCRKCYYVPGLRARYRTFRPKRRRLRGRTYGYCILCGQWRFIVALERCRTCYSLYVADLPSSLLEDAVRQANIELYAQRAARRLPLFTDVRTLFTWPSLVAQAERLLEKNNPLASGSRARIVMDLPSLPVALASRTALQAYRGAPRYGPCQLKPM